MLIKYSNGKINNIYKNKDEAEKEIKKSTDKKKEKKENVDSKRD